MPRSQEFSRSVTAANALSDSEAEESFSLGRIKKRRSTRFTSTRSQVITNSNESETSQQGSFTSPSNYHTPASSILYKSNHNNNSTGYENTSAASPSSPVIDISNVQYTPIDRFRWFLWRCIYLKIIKCVNFDVWLLSRFQSYKKYVILLLLVPLVLGILCGAWYKGSYSTAFEDLSSNASTLSSYIYSIVSYPFVHKSTVVVESTSEESSCSEKASGILNYIWLSFYNFFLFIFSKLKEVISLNHHTTHTTLQSESITNKDLKLITNEVERLRDIVVKFKESNLKTVVKDDSVIKIQNDIASLRAEFQSLTESVKTLEKEVSKKTAEFSTKYADDVKKYHDHISSINAEMKDYENKLLSLTSNCCDQKWTISDFAANFEKYFLAALKSVVVRDKDKASPYYFFSEWLQSKLASDKETLSKELKLEFEKMKTTGAKYDENIYSVVEKVVRNLTTLNKSELKVDGAFSLEMVQKLIKEAILLYDADKTGLVDYALESGGGSVLSTRCSESYAEKDGTISVLGLPLWSTHNSPRTAIQPGMQPGQCWAFKGSQGFLVIQLAYTIYPTGFTLEHIPASLSPMGSIDSAPKDFSVWGLSSENDNEGALLGKFSYDEHGEPLQYFAVQKTYPVPFSFVELKIDSNHGNLEYTCLYRFRVHGNFKRT